MLRLFCPVGADSCTGWSTWRCCSAKARPWPGAACAGLRCPPTFTGAPYLVASWDGFCLVLAVLTWVIIARAGTAHLRRVATSENPGRVRLFAAVLGATGASLFAVALR